MGCNSGAKVEVEWAQIIGILFKLLCHVVVEGIGILCCSEAVKDEREENVFF